MEQDNDDGGGDNDMAEDVDKDRDYNVPPNKSTVGNNSNTSPLSSSGEEVEHALDRKQVTEPCKINVKEMKCWGGTPNAQLLS